MRIRHALSFLFAAASPALAAGTFTVSNSNDGGMGSLRQAILDANAANGGTINIAVGGLISLQNPLPPISTAITLNGNNILVSGNNAVRVFFVDALAANVTFNNLSIIGGRAKGGDGGSEGGGGLGAGGGIFLNAGNLSLSNVTFAFNAAVGGAGGIGSSDGTQYNGGGGGLGGNGGINQGGGGGYLDYGGDNTGGGGGFDTAGTNNKGLGGGEGGIGPVHGGGNAYAPGAGGGGGSLSSPGKDGGPNGGGDGGKFGGGGASQINTGGNGGDFGGGGAGLNHGGNGGFGGGGGRGFNSGGNGGFGGGGGAAAMNQVFGAGGAFGGNSGPNALVPLFGGGGGALGGHVFIRGGASLNLLDTGTDTGTVTPGIGGSVPGIAGTGAPGKAAGTAFFISGVTHINVSAGQSRIIPGTIDDVGPYLGTSTAAGFTAGEIVKGGPGTMEFSGYNSYAGGTVISQGTLIVNGTTSLGTGPVTLNDSDTGANDVTLFTKSRLDGNFTVAANGSGKTTIIAAPPSTSVFRIVGSIALNRSLTFVGQVSYPQDAAHNLPQNVLIGPITGPGGLTFTGGNLFQFASSARTYTGPTLVTGNTTLSINDTISSPVNSVVQIDGGSSLVLEGLLDAGATIAGLTGAGSVSNNVNRGQGSLLNLVNTTGGVHTFTGTLDGRVAIVQSGNDTFEIGAQDNLSSSLRVTAGAIKLLGNQRLTSFEVQKTDAGKQTADLNGHSVFLLGNPMALAGFYNRLRGLIGDSSDGIYDSTATSHDAIGFQYPAPGGGLLLKLTRKGDANLDGTVNFADLVTVAQHYGSTGVYWDTGDFDYDNSVGFSDLVAIAQNYGSSFPSAPIPGASAEFNEDLVATFASVPEPSPLALFGIASAAILKRRRYPSLRM